MTDAVEASRHSHQFSWGGEKMIEEAAAEAIRDLSSAIREAAPHVYSAAQGMVYAEIFSSILFVLIFAASIFVSYKALRWGIKGVNSHTVDEDIAIPATIFSSVGALISIPCFFINLYNIIWYSLAFEYETIRAITGLVN